MTKHAIATDRLSKSYGDYEAVRRLSLVVRAGTITAFLGMNGAGKSTTINMLLGMLHPSSGNGELLGRPITEERSLIKSRERVAFVSENKRLYDYMTVGQMISFTKSFYSDWRPEMEQSLLRQYRLPVAKKINSLSKGMRTKLGLLLAFARRPELLILDEPSEGLDPVGIEELLENFVALCSTGTTIFFSSHQIPEVERVADHVCMLHKGSLVLDADMDELRHSYQRVNLSFDSPRSESEFRFEGVESVEARGRHLSVVLSKNAENLMEFASQAGARSIETSPVSLREIFLEKVKVN